jgi:hypothetical protein
VTSLGQLAAIAGGIVGTVSGAVSAGAAVLMYKRQRQEDAASDSGDLLSMIDRKALRLAEAVKDQWQTKSVNGAFTILFLSLYDG